jgi:glycosyltransferase involved in cell wall biosynthesis
MNDIASLSSKNGFESYIAYGHKANKSSLYTIKIGNKVDRLFHALSTRIFDNHGLCSKNATKHFLERVDQINPDIIHLHNVHGYYINYRMLFERLSFRNVPVVWTMHDCWAFTGHCAYYDSVNCKKWITGCYDCPQKRSYPASFLCDRSRKNYSDKKDSFISMKNLTIVPVSNWLNKEVSNSFFGIYPSIVIHNGVDVEVFNYSVKTYPFLEDKFVILGVANIWDRRKGLDDFIELSKYLNANEIIMLVGLSKNQQAKLPHNIIAIEKTENVRELAQLYSRSDMFLNPTWEDNFPTTNIEALACGTCVVTYDTGGSPEAITKETGFVVKQGDICTLLKVIERVKKEGKERYFKSCRERAVKHFDNRNRYKEYIDLYNSLVF